MLTVSRLRSPLRSVVIVSGRNIYIATPYPTVSLAQKEMAGRGICASGTGDVAVPGRTIGWGSMYESLYICTSLHYLFRFKWV